MDAQEVWQAERNAVIARMRIEREESAERAADEARQAERQARTEAALHVRAMTGEPIPDIASVLARARALTEADGPGRDDGAEYGSVARPAVYATAADGTPVEITARPRAGVARSVSEAADDALLARAKAMQADTFMAVQIARSQRRRSGAGRAQDATVSRGSGEWDGGVISR